MTTFARVPKIDFVRNSRSTKQIDAVRLRRMFAYVVEVSCSLQSIARMSSFARARKNDLSGFLRL